MSFVASAGREVVSRCYAAAEAARWNLPVDLFSAALEASASRAFAAKTPTSAEVARYMESLHLADLALACACANGDEEAWTHFVTAHQNGLRRAADAMAASGDARELADGLYGELFGLRQAGAAGQSLFRYFYGRSTLSTWLRTVLAQRLIDRQRSYRRLEPLPDDESADRPFAVAADDPQAERPRWLAAVQQALARAFEGLTPRDRLRVSLYHADGLTLAATGRALGEHEATVSRQLGRTRRDVRAAVEEELARLGLDERARREAFQSLANDPGPIDVRDLVGPPARKIAPADRSTK